MEQPKIDGLECLSSSIKNLGYIRYDYIPNDNIPKYSDGTPVFYIIVEISKWGQDELNNPDIKISILLPEANEGEEDKRIEYYSLAKALGYLPKGSQYKFDWNKICKNTCNIDYEYEDVSKLVEKIEKHNYLDIIETFNNLANEEKTKHKDTIKEIKAQIYLYKNIFSIVENSSEFKFEDINNNNERIFIPTELICDSIKYGKDGNWLDGCITGLYFEKDNRYKKINFGINVQCSRKEDKDKRDKLLNYLEKKFNNKFKGDNWKYMRLVRFDPKNYKDIKPEQFKEKIKEEIGNYIEKYSEAINNLIFK